MLVQYCVLEEMWTTYTFSKEHDIIPFSYKTWLQEKVEFCPFTSLYLTKIDAKKADICKKAFESEKLRITLNLNKK